MNPTSSPTTTTPSTTGAQFVSLKAVTAGHGTCDSDNWVVGVIDDNTLVAVNHFSHNGLGLHKDMEAFFNPQGIQVCYDGYVLEK